MFGLATKSDIEMLRRNMLALFDALQEDHRYIAEKIGRLKETVTMTQAELATALGNVADQLNKGIAEVVAAIAQSGNTTPATDAAVNRLKAAAQALDDLNADSPPP